jgi:hypothetical protein
MQTVVMVEMMLAEISLVGMLDKVDLGMALVVMEPMALREI